MDDNEIPDPPSFSLSEEKTINVTRDADGQPDQQRMGSYANLCPGEVILGKFKIIEQIGQGGMGSVYRVDHLFLGRQFALKCLNRQQSNDPSWRRFQNEAKAANKLDHANLIKVYEFDLLPDGRPFFLMELVDGTTLADAMKGGGPFFPLDRVLNIMIQVAFAIKYAHDHGIVHRDLKPSNIMLIKNTEGGEKDSVKVVDFGIAKLTGVDEFNQQTLTKTGEVFGSPLYMSPEQCRGTLVDHRSDLYSLGCVFYELLTGAPPFIGESALNTMMKHQSENQLSLKEASLGVQFPAEVERIVAKLLEKDPTHRYQSAHDLALDLLPLIQGEFPSRPVSRIPTLHRLDALPPPIPQTTSTSPVQWLLLVGALVATFMAGMATCYVLFVQQAKTAPAAAPAVSQAPPLKALKPGYWSSIKDGTRIFHFPDDRPSLGKLSFGDNNLIPASGKVETKASNQIGLFPSQYLIENPQLMSRFRPDEIALIDFGDSQAAGSRTFKQLANFTGLKALNVSKTAIQANDVPHMNGMKGLLNLNLAYCQQIKATDLLKLAALKNLNCMDLTQVPNVPEFIATLARLPQLHQISIAACALNDDDLKKLGNSESLQVLSVAWNTQITDRGVSYLSNLKNLEWLDLTHTSVTPKCIESLKRMPKLKKIEMGLLNKWTEDDRNEFHEKLTRERKGIAISWNDMPTHDPDLTMHGFKWNGPGLLCRMAVSPSEFMEVLTRTTETWPAR